MSTGLLLYQGHLTSMAKHKNSVLSKSLLLNILMVIIIMATKWIKQIM